MNINDIDFKELIVHTDHRNRGVYSRAVYYNPITEKFIKLWNEDFFYKKFFEITCKTPDFFKEISILEEIITNEKGDILGYITPKSKMILSHEIENNKIRDLSERITKQSNKYNIVYIDLVPNNIATKNDKYYIIDLEPSIPLSELGEINSLKSILEYNPYFYVKSLSNLLEPFMDIGSKIKTFRFQTHKEKEIKYGTANGRIYLEHEYLPTLKGKTLFVGVNYYTEFYHLLVQSPELFETLDILEEKIEYGSPYKHYIGNILDFENQGYLYDNVCSFGILGHNDGWDVIKTKEEVIKCIEVLDSVVKPGGTLLLGPANQTFNIEWWDEIYNIPVLKKYEILMLKKIDINYIWHGKKNAN